MKRIIFGDLGGGGYGLKVSQPGYDVDSATDEQLAFDSTRTPLSILRPYVTEQALPFISGPYNAIDYGMPSAAPNVVTIPVGGLPHPLGYPPLLMTAFRVQEKAGGLAVIERGVILGPSLVFDYQVDTGGAGIVGFRKIYLSATASAVYFCCHSYVMAGFFLPARTVNAYFNVLYNRAA